MIWLWAVAGAYAGGMVLVWGAAYGSLRPGRPRRRAWAIASGVALMWPPWLVAFRRGNRKALVVSWVDQLERELQALGR